MGDGLQEKHRTQTIGDGRRSEVGGQKEEKN